MSRVVRRILPIATTVITSTRTRDARRWLAERRRRRRREPHRVLYFHQVDDPYSHLAAQVLARLAERYDVAIEPHLVGPPPDAAAPERQRLAEFARKDAADVAPTYGLAFSRCMAPDAGLVALATRILAGAIAANRFIEAAPSVGSALWHGDRAGLAELARENSLADSAAASAAVAAGTALREKLGHYLGGMFHYGGEWYWGVDRLAHLERRLRLLAARRPGAGDAPIVARPEARNAWETVGERRLTVEFYASLRSPYTYIAMERVYALPQHYPVDLVLRPVLPMVMRGLPVPAAKRIYITLDTKREADDLGVPFGRICDPVGRPVQRGFSLYPWARERGVAAEYLLSFARGAFADGIDLAEDAGLRRIVEGVGLSWDEAVEYLDGDGWQGELEENREQLFALGLWGVPSFRIVGEAGQPDFCTWGQDRIWLLEQQIAKRTNATPKDERA